MGTKSDEATSQLGLLTDLLDAHVHIAGDIVRIGLTRWALYGSIPFDGNVLVAEYDSPEEAGRALTFLGPNRGW